jgi:excisionase family DNA binding protein
VAETTQSRGAFKLKEACEYLGGISSVTLRRLIARGLIRRHPALRHILISKAELDRFLRQCEPD